MTRPVLVVAEEEARLECADGRIALSRPVGGLEALTEVVEELAAKAGDGRAIEVRLESPWVQLRRLRDLPPVSHADLRKLVQSEPNRFFRRRATQVTVSVAWKAGKAGDVALAAACEEGVVAAVGEGLRRVNTVACPLAPAEPEFRELHLSTSTMRRGRRRWFMSRVGPATALAVSAWVGAAAIYAGDLILDLRASEIALDSLSSRAEAVRAVEERIGEVAAVAEALRLPSEDGRWTSQVLDVLSSQLPDSGYVTRLSANRSGAIVELRQAEIPLDTVEGAPSPPGWQVTPTRPPAVEEDGAWHLVRIEIRRTDGRS